MNIYNKIALIVFVGLNLIAFLTMFLDKLKARHNDRRISEKVLFLWALCFGALGIYSGMFIFRHKTQKWYFVLGVPVITFVNLYLLDRILAFLQSGLLPF
jgi:uncharacterized membrane protein YsdA (DUF1294 family)